MTGKGRRLSRLFSPTSRRTVLVPIDHAVTLGPVSGLGQLTSLLPKLIDGGANGIIGHKGIIANYGDILEKTPFIMQLSASTDLGPSQHHKVLVRGLDSALRLGVDAVAIHVNIGDEQEPQMLRDLGFLSDESDRYGMPLLAMMYYTPQRDRQEKSEIAVLRHLARLGQELGADIVKIPCPANSESLSAVAECCNIPIVIGGGPKLKLEIMLQRIRDAVASGIRGVAIGRNVFQQDNVRETIHRIGSIVHTRPTNRVSRLSYRSCARDN